MSIFIVFRIFVSLSCPGVMKKAVCPEIIHFSIILCETSTVNLVFAYTNHLFVSKWWWKQSVWLLTDDETKLYDDKLMMKPNYDKSNRWWKQTMWWATEIRKQKHGSYLPQHGGELLLAVRVHSLNVLSQHETLEVHLLHSVLQMHNAL